MLTKSKNLFLIIKTLIAVILLVLSSTLLIQGYSSIECSRDNLSKECLTIEALSKGCLPNLSITSQAEYTNINAQSCTQFKKYLGELESTSKKYSTPTLKLSPYHIAGIIQRETRWGQIGVGSGCDITGDGGFGKGIAQMDTRFNPGIESGTTVKATKKYGNEEFSWKSCQDNVKYVGAHLLNTEDNYKSKFVNILSDAGLNVKSNDNGFEDSKTSNAYLQLMIDSYNAGPGGIVDRTDRSCTANRDGVVNDSCTTGKDYGAAVMKNSIEFYECLNNRRPTGDELLQSNTSSDKSRKLQECMTKIRSTINGSVNVPSNYNFSNEVRRYISVTTKLVGSPVKNEEEYFGQCVTLVKDYQKSIGVPYAAWAAEGPAEKWDNYKKGDKTGLEDNDKYKTVAITDFNLLETGDIMIVKSSLSYGHTGILISKTESNFKLFDQWVLPSDHLPMARDYDKSKFTGAIRYIKK